MARNTSVGDELFEMVEVYASLGDHRTGTEVDDTTRQWLRSVLEASGAVVEEHPYEFERFEGESRVVVDGDEVASIPVWYSAVGEWRDARVRVEPLEMLAGLIALDLDARIEAARARGDAVVACATGPRLVAHNRPPVLPPGPPAVVVGGDVGDREVVVDFDGRVGPASSATVVATFGADVANPVVIATPLTGWFRCAGERGTGVAVAVDLATRLAPRYPVQLVATTGHELGHLGVRDHLRRRTRTPRAVAYVGASVAAGTRASGALRLVATRQGLLDAPAEVTDEVAASLARAGVEIGETGWSGGEAGDWRALGAPIVAVTGAGAEFHSPDDGPEVTSPELLATVADAMADATEALLSA